MIRVNTPPKWVFGVLKFQSFLKIRENLIQVKP